MANHAGGLALLLLVVAGCMSNGPTSSPASADRYADGLPRALGGVPVVRGSAALDHAKAAGDSTPFLVGGWVTFYPSVRSCFDQPAGDTSWRHDCGAPGFSDRAGADDPALTAAVTFHFVRAGLSTGPAVVEVEVHDPRAVACGADAAACARMMVVQRLVWTGDAATDPRPLSAQAVQGALGTIQPGAVLTPFGPDSMFSDCGGQLSAGRVYLVASEPAAMPAVTVVAIEPTAAARALALALAPGAAAALTPAALVCSGINSNAPLPSQWTEYRWLAVENVALLVRTHSGPIAADQAFLANLEDALERVAASSR